MAITKEIIIGRIEVVGTWNVQVATDTVIKEDGVQISTSRHRHILHPCKYKSDGSTWEDTDISTESKEVQSISSISSSSPLSFTTSFSLLFAASSF